ncbi:MAG: hypothetical protein JNK05_28645 [Myxococcales bacterium]|nr:hypothetical protein [Myxococcales bacterium]
MTSVVRVVFALVVLALAACSERRLGLAERGSSFGHTSDGSGPVFAPESGVRDMDAASAPAPFSRGGCDDSCGSGTCRTACIRDVDPCEGVECEQGFVCLNGNCLSRCLCGACIGVRCGAGAYCDPETGACVEYARCRGRTCGAGEICVEYCDVPNPCSDVVCPQGFYCAEGQCLRDLCATVRCPPDHTCNPRTGECVEVRCGGGGGGGSVPPCPRGQARDRNGRCVCVEYCAPDAECGSPNGCGGACNDNCDDAGDAGDASDSSDVVIDASDASIDRTMPDASADATPSDVQAPRPFDSGVSTCVAQCPRGGACGAPDGCGGRCPGTCAAGFVCQQMAGGPVCVCAGRCPADAWCGQDDGCGRRCPGRCPVGASCNEDRACACEPFCPPGAWCGQPNGCGGTCRGWCPFGRGCDTRNQCSLCAPRCAPGVACGAPDGCGGRCAGACPVGSTCGAERVCLVQRAGCNRASDCPTGWPCVAGRCVAPCPPGREFCNEGLCCDASEQCVSGTCVPRPM